jgi:hypothetical protein
MMLFPPNQRKALLLLARLLYAREGFKDEHFPLFRGSHSLAVVKAASADLHSVARSLALFASDLAERPAREWPGARLADRFALKISRLAHQIELAIDDCRPPKKRGSRGS